MRETIRKIWYYIFYGFFILVFVWVSGQLFFEQRAARLVVSVMELIFPEEEVVEKLDHLRVIYPDEPAGLEPTSNNSAVRQRLNNIYEPLVRADRDLKLRTALAVSWGLIDDLTWEFRLRSDVVFHDGTRFDAQDVVASLERAISFEGSDLAVILVPIDKIEILDDYTLRIKTHNPDPLLLQKLSTVFMIPSEKKNEKAFDPVGTGSYRFVSREFGDRIIVEKFADYWGDEAKFTKVDMISRLNKSERINMFMRGGADLLAFVPFDAVSVVEEMGFAISGIPSLEVQFLLFNMNSGYFENPENRKVFSLAIDQEVLVNIVGGFARPVSQFVSNGVFGFNPDIVVHEYDLKKAKKLAVETGIKGSRVSFHLPVGLEILGEYVREQLAEIGVFVVVSYLDGGELLESMAERKADLYFFGFKAELGDAADFLSVMMRTGASLNVGSYSNPNVDQMIDSSLKEMDPTTRLFDLQESMRVIVEDDVVGIPLFENETLYSFVDKLDMHPRIDGFIYFDELILK